MHENKTVLIIDDDMDQIEVYKIILNSSGYVTEVAHCPEEAWDKAKRVQPDLIMLDVMFGVQEKSRGLDMAIRLKRDAALAPIPILMVTAVNSAHPGFDVHPSKNDQFLPVDGFLNKPVDPEVLLTNVWDLIDKRTSRWVNWPDSTA